MKNFYYRNKSGQEIGPLNLDALAKLRFAGVLDGDTPVRSADSTEWKTCREVIADPSHSTQPKAGPEAKEKSPVSPILIAFVISGALVYGGMTLYKSIAASTTLSYGFFANAVLLHPKVEVDGQPFESGNHLKPGRHEISVSLENVEPYKQRFWIFHGQKDLGPLPLELSKGSVS